MAKNYFTAPLSNITNLKNLQSKTNTKHKPILSDVEKTVLLSHKHSEETEISSMSKYSQKISLYLESLDIEYQFIEKETTFEMRSLLIDWIISCHDKMNLVDDTLHFSIFLCDRFLSDRPIPSSRLQLVGITALFIAAKYEEVICPDLNSFILLADKNYTEVDLKKAEKYMLYALNYDLKFVNPLFFIRRGSKANNYERKTRKMAKYFLELMCLYKDFYQFKKAVIGTTAMYLARKICQTDINKNLFFYYSNVYRDQIKECFDKLVNLINIDPEYINLENKYNKDSMYRVNIVARMFANEYFN